MSLIIALATDLVAITLLAYVLYFRRHRRRDLLLSYSALNVGVFAVTVALGSVEVGIGLGIGLFGILSIIRLRSDQITQQEIAYYFVSLALGLLTGLQPAQWWVAPVLSALMVAVMFVVDSRHVAPRTHRHTVTLDRAFTDQALLADHLSERLSAEIMRVEPLEVDLVRDTTVVDVRYQIVKQEDGPSREHEGHDHRGHAARQYARPVVNAVGAGSEARRTHQPPAGPATS